MAIVRRTRLVCLPRRRRTASVLAPILYWPAMLASSNRNDVRHWFDNPHDAVRSQTARMEKAKPSRLPPRRLCLEKKHPDNSSTDQGGGPRIRIHGFRGSSGGFAKLTAICRAYSAACYPRQNARRANP